MKSAILNSLAAATMLASGAAAAQSACTTLDTLPATISEPGNYCLAANHATNITSGTLINIAANDVTLDCRQFTLRNNAASATGSSSAIVALNRNNVTIENCRVIGGFTHGINVSQNNSQPNLSYYNIVRNNFIAGPYRNGIVAFGSAIEIRDNRIYDIGGQLNAPVNGILIGGSDVGGFKFQMVQGNRIAGTNSPSRAAYGIYSTGSIGSVFHENLVSGTSSAGGAYKAYGIMVLTGAGITVTDNYISDAGPGSDSVGVQTPADGGVCYDNQIWSVVPTSGCDASLGNY